MNKLMISPKIDENRIKQFEDAIDEVVAVFKQRKEIISIILFGSVARREHSLQRSDIDFYFIVDKEGYEDRYEQEIKKKASEIGIKHKVTIQIELQETAVKDADRSLLLKIAEEGIVLYNRGSIIISDAVLGIKPHTLLVFSTSKNSLKERVKLSRLLNGWINRIRKKEIIHKPLIDDDSIFGTGKGILLVRNDRLKEIEDIFKELNIEYKSKGFFYR